MRAKAYFSRLQEMARRIVAAVRVAVIACGSISAQQPSTGYTFRSQSELMLVNVTVRDKDDKIVRDLKREDFTVVENNKAQQVLSFDLENTDAAVSTAMAEAKLLATAPASLPSSASAPNSTAFKDR